MLLHCTNLSCTNNLSLACAHNLRVCVCLLRVCVQNSIYPNRTAARARELCIQECARETENHCTIFICYIRQTAPCCCRCCCGCCSHATHTLYTLFRADRGTRAHSPIGFSLAPPCAQIIQSCKPTRTLERACSPQTHVCWHTWATGREFARACTLLWGARARMCVCALSARCGDIILALLSSSKTRSRAATLSSWERARMFIFLSGL